MVISYKPPISQKGGYYRKGISDVIATLLLVMVTVMLVFFVNTFFVDIAQNAGTSTNRALLQNQKLSQKVIIPTAYCCGAYICFEIKALGTNDFPIPTEQTDYFVNNKPRKIYPWGLSGLGPDCLDNPVLEPGQGCFGKVEGPCGNDLLFKAVLPWGMQNFRVVSPESGN
jgi:flagellin-like protein